MRKISALIFTAALLLSSLTVFNLAGADTNVSGTINVDTTWTSAGSPYVFSAQVTIAEGATLTIEPGAKVNLGAFNLQVNGTLKASGNSSNPIEFSSDTSSNAKIVFEPSSTDYNASDGSGCTIENAEINASITVNGAAPRIAGNQIIGTISINQAAPTIEGNNISGGSGADAISVEAESAPTIISNVISGKTVGVGFNMHSNGLNNSYSAVVENNTISGCDIGVGVGEGQGSIRVAGNLIFGSGTGISVTNASAAVSILRNLVMNNTRGVDVGALVAIQENTIYNNTVGIYYQTVEQSLINYNNIMNNTQYNLQLTEASPSSLDVTYNYWGTLNITAIGTGIYDVNDNSTLGEAVYLPALNNPYATAPTIPGVDMSPTPQPSPTTTLPGSTSTPRTTPTHTATLTATPPASEGILGQVEIGVILALVVVIVLAVIIVLRKGGSKKPSPDAAAEQPT